LLVSGFIAVWTPYDNPTAPFVRLNGTIAGAPYPGGAFYRDVSPGFYHITVDSEGVGVNPSWDVTLNPGEVVYVNVAVGRRLQRPEIHRLPGAA
jgi:hypothetical protein